LNGFIFSVQSIWMLFITDCYRPRLSPWMLLVQVVYVAASDALQLHNCYETACAIADLQVVAGCSTIFVSLQCAIFFALFFNFYVRTYGRKPSDVPKKVQ
jgi:hypothetical protein